MKGVMELFKGDAVKFFGINKRIVSATTVSAAVRTELVHVHVQKNINDWILEADDGSFIHFEFQSSHDQNDLSRFMVSDAILYYKMQRPIRTIVVYTANIKNTTTVLNAGAIRYSVDAFYMSAMDGDRTYETIRAKVAAGEPLTKQDLMSIVFLPMMKNSVDNVAVFERSINLSKEIHAKDEQLQIQAMLQLLAGKFIKNRDILLKLKEVLNMSIIGKMIWDEGMEKGMEKGIREGAINIAKKMLKRGTPIEIVMEDTGLDEAIISKLQEELHAFA